LKYLKSRTVRHGDGALVAELFRESAPLHSGLAAKLVNVFDHIFEAEAGVGVVTQEVSSREKPARTVGFTYMGFIEAAAMKAYVDAPVPGMASAFLNAVTDKSLGVFMDRKAQAAANLGDGIDHALIALSVSPMDLGDPAFNVVFNELYTNYLQNVRGYNIRTVFSEVDVLLKDFMIAAGLTPQKQFADARTENAALTFPSNAASERWFMAANRASSHLQHAMSAAVLMSYVKPALRLTPSEQRLLLLAIDGLNDVEVATSLGISKDAVKSTWKTIYSHVEDVMPVVFGGHDVGNGTSRGAEKRRRVVSHVRANLQELRPHYTRRGSR
jgi:hypothetical protein